MLYFFYHLVIFKIPFEFYSYIYFNIPIYSLSLPASVLSHLHSPSLISHMPNPSQSIILRCVSIGGVLLSTYYTLYYLVIAFEPVIPSRQSYIATENVSQKCMYEFVSFFILFGTDNINNEPIYILIMPFSYFFFCIKLFTVFLLSLKCFCCTKIQ